MIPRSQDRDRGRGEDRDRDRARGEDRDRGRTWRYNVYEHAHQ